MLQKVLETIKKPFTLGVIGLTLLMSNSGNAQVATTYTFSSSNTLYSPITRGTVLGNSSSSDELFVDPLKPLGDWMPTGPGFPIGFNFDYNGQIFDRFALSNRGMLSLGQSSLTPSVNIGGYAMHAYGIYPSQLTSRICAIGDRIEAQPGASIRFNTIGIAPNRMLVVQFENYKKEGVIGIGDSYNFQIRLHETTNVLDIVYGPLTNNNVPYNYYQVGILGFSNADFNIRTINTDWNLSVAGTSTDDTAVISNNVYPPSGLTYTWTPPAKVYSSSTTSTPTIINVAPLATDQLMLQLKVSVDEIGAILDVTNIDVGTNGTTLLSDIDNLKIYFTGSSPKFSNTTLFGSIASSPSVANSISGSASLTRGDNYFWVTYDVSASANLGNFLDAEITAITVGGISYIPTITAPAGNREIASAMSFVSTTSTPAPTAKVGQGERAHIMGVEIVTSHTGAPINLTSLDINTNGTTDLSDITNLQVWYSGNTKTLDDTILFATVNAPGATQIVSGLQPLVNDTNYFWITYDVSASATINNRLDAECITVTLDGLSVTPTLIAPLGDREIRLNYCIPTYDDMAYSCLNDYFIDGVSTNGGISNINNLSSGCSGNKNNYKKFYNHVLTIAKNTSFDITIQDIGGTNGFAVWIDYNQDGIFDDVTERVFAPTFNNLSSVTGVIRIPCSALTGSTVLRVRSMDYNVPPNACVDLFAGETEDYIINIIDNPMVYVSSEALQERGLVSPGATNRSVLHIPVKAFGCGMATTTELVFSTSGTTNTSDIISAKLYSTRNNNLFNTNKLLGTVLNPNGQFVFALTDTLFGEINDTNNYWLTYDVALGATLGNTIDATFDSIQATGTMYHIPTTTSPSGDVLITSPMTFVSTTTTSGPVSKVEIGSLDSVIVGVEIITSHTGAPIDLTSLDVSTNGTTNLADIANLKVWYTGNSKTFATTKQFGSTVALPTPIQIITGAQPLTNDTNYFWITYDIAESAIIGDSVDAEVTSITVDGSAYAPSVTAPTGLREIRASYCTINLYNSSCSSADFIDNVYTIGATTNISNLASDCNGRANNYAYYPGQKITIERGKSFTINYQAGLAFNQGFKIFIDYNQDGDYQDAGEEVASAPSSILLNTSTITVPCTAPLGITRMRVRCAFLVTPATACSNEDFGEVEEYDIEILDNPITYNGSLAIQTTRTLAAPGYTNADVLRMPIVVAGCGQMDATQFDLASTGSTSLGDITRAKIYYTGNNPNFSSSILFGSVAFPNGAYSITGTQTLANDTNNFWLVYDIAPTASYGVILDAEFNGVVINGVSQLPTTTSPSGDILVDGPMTFVSTTTTSGPVSKVEIGSSDSVIVGVEVITSHTGAPIDLTSLDVSTNGTTDLADIGNLKVWYTGNSKTFATTTQFGSTVSLPASTQTIIGTQPLTNDTNYFWITYDIARGAIVGDSVDAEVTSITIDGNVYTPSVTAPTGLRKIRGFYCLPDYTDGCNTDYIARVQLKTLDNFSGCTGPFTFYNGLSVPTLLQGETDTISITYGNDPNQYARAWIDYNDDGDFDDSGEDLGIQLPANAGPSGTSTIIFTVPCNSSIGLLRLRIRGGDDRQPLATEACSTSGSGYGEGEDYLINVIPNSVVYNTSFAIQSATTKVDPGRTDVNVLRLPISVLGCGSIDVTQFDFNTGTSTSANDIVSAKLYYTGPSSTFETSTLFGSFISPNGIFSITGTQPLMEDTNNFWLVYDVATAASYGNVLDAEFNGVIINGVSHIPTIISPSGDILIDLPMTFVSATTTQGPISKAGIGVRDNHIIGVEVVTSTLGASVNLTSLDITTLGTTDLADITNLQVWYTGNDKTFSTTTFFGSEATPMATQTIIGNQPLMNDTNYFWITYDITASATLGDTVDAECIGLSIDGVPQPIPIVTSPAGNRQIRFDYCNPVYNFECSYSNINDVITTDGITNINNTSTGCNGQINNYIYYPLQTVTVLQGGQFTLNMQAAVTSYQGLGVWIDFNDNGSFIDAGEFVYSSSVPYNALESTNIMVPLTAYVGNVRMRIRTIEWDILKNGDVCATLDGGETEDYNVNILPVLAPSTYVWNQTTPADFNVSTNWTPSRINPANINDMLVFDIGGAITATNVPTQAVSQIIVDNNTQLTLQANGPVNLIAADSLKLISGSIITGNNVTLTLGTNESSTGGLTGAGVIDGTFKRWIGTTVSTWEFPMVVGADNRHITVDYTTAPLTGGTLTTQFVSGEPYTTGLPITDGLIVADAIGKDGIWRIKSSSTLSGGNYTLTAYASNFKGVGDYANLILVRKKTIVSPWELEGVNVPTTGTDTDPVLSRTGMLSFGDFGVAGNSALNPLPVTLINFTGLADTKNTYLNWKTANETNNKGFEVERSTDGKAFHYLTFVDGAKNSGSTQSYSVTDEDAFAKTQSDVLYYRLKQLDFNGNYTYSNVVTVKSSQLQSASISVYPNPFTTGFNLSVIAEEQSIAQMMIVDIQGKVLSVEDIGCNKGVNEFTIDELSTARNGVYFIKMTINGKTTTTRLVKID